MITKIDDFIKRVESTAEEDLFTSRTFYHLSSSMFHEMCELLKEVEISEKERKIILQSLMDYEYEVKTAVVRAELANKLDDAEEYDKFRQEVSHLKDKFVT